MAPTTRVLLVEHLDATGAAPSDARAHAHALKAAGLAVEAVVLDGGGSEDLLFASRERESAAGFDVLDSGPRGLSALGSRLRDARVDLVLWASASPGGGPASRAIPPGMRAAWWPTGHAPAGATRGALPALDPALVPLDGSAVDSDRLARRKLALWDGPFALVPAPPSPRTASRLLDAFALASEDRDEVDLVVLDHPEAAMEELSRRAGVAQRVHFVGPAPREAERAWLASASLALLSGDAPVSGGLVLRALADGCPLLAVGDASRPLAAWLRGHDLAWAHGEDDDAVSRAIASALDGERVVLDVRERGRVLADKHDAASLGARVAEAVRALLARERRAA